MTSYRDIGRDFEFDFDIGDLFEYEGPAPGTLGPPMAPKASYVMIEKFQPGSFGLPADFEKIYGKILLRVAHLLAAAQRLNMPSEVVLMGYPDAPGSDTKTTNLAFNRADAVRTILRKLVGDAKGSADRVTFSIYTNTAPGTGLKQCVDVRLPRNCQTFFAEYDQQSFDHDVIGYLKNPNVTNKRQRFDSLLFVGQELDARVRERARQALAAKGMPATMKPLSVGNPVTIRNGLTDLSTMQLTLFRKYHPGFPDSLPDSLMSCFLKFANGELRSPHAAFDTGKNKDRKRFGVGEPDSFHVFFFAEFAFLCIDWGIDVTPWTRALPALVAAQEVFIYIYRENPTLPPPPLEDAVPTVPAKVVHPLDKFGARNFKSIDSSQTKGVGQSDAARLAALADKYRRLTGVENQRAAMTQNLVRAQLLK